MKQRNEKDMQHRKQTVKLYHYLLTLTTSKVNALSPLVKGKTVILDLRKQDPAMCCL